jgi:hypothetical protein
MLQAGFFFENLEKRFRPGHPLASAQLVNHSPRLPGNLSSQADELAITLLELLPPVFGQALGGTRDFQNPTLGASSMIDDFKGDALATLRCVSETG